MTTILRRPIHHTPRAQAATPPTPVAGRPRVTSGPELTKEELLGAAKRDLVDTTWVSELTGLPPHTIYIYIGRGSAPQPDMRLCGGPVWHKETIIEWERDRPKRSNKGVK